MTIPVDPLLPLGPTARTTPLPIRPMMLPGIALLAILVIGLASSVYALVFKRAELPAAAVTWSHVLGGETASDIAQLLQKENPLEDPLVTFDRATSYVLTGDLGRFVRRGCGNWLFLTDELVLRPGREGNFANHIAAVERVAGFLKSRNIALVVLPVPDKSRIEAAELCGVDRPTVVAGRLREFEEQLRQGGIAVVDVSRPMEAAGGELYYHTDTHWNEHGAKTVAGTLAAALRQAGLAPTQKAEFRVVSEPLQERVGDLIRFAGLERLPWPLRPRGDEVALTEIEQTAAANVGILDETPPPELVIVGTSFSNASNFSPFLALALGSPVENEAISGGGLFTSARKYFAKPEFSKSPPHMIVWEIPERMLEEYVPAVDDDWTKSLGISQPAK